MKTSPFIAAYLTVLSTIATTQAQVLNPTLADNSPSTLIVQNTFEPPLSVQSSDKFVPLNNVAFFSGGKQALEKHIESLDLYPYLAREIQAEGTVWVRFRVQPSGYLTDIQVVKSRGPLLDSAAVKVVGRMPRWYPAHRSGVAVSSLVELPVTFRLD
ncbi:energy transducer TonB [Spirosoma areae]